MISGATGMIGSFLTDVLLEKNMRENLNISIIALGRNEKKAYDRFNLWWNSSSFKFVKYSLGEKLDIHEHVDYIFHLASATHPLQYSTDPVGTLLINIEGLKELLDWGKEHQIERFLFTSSVEIYGENRGDVDKFNESYMGYLDCNNMRACYSEGKRASEALSQGYISQYGMDIVIPRLARVYGPTMLNTDSKAISQFIKRGINGEDIILKSEGTQLFSYIFVADAVTALLKVLFEGETGEAYNVSDSLSDVMLKDLAGKIASFSGSSVKFELPNDIEKRGYSKSTKATLDSTKLEKLEWHADYPFERGLELTLEILKDIWT